jgi:cystathionine beta-lyase/cystathionine gamma-synthase
MLALLRAGDHVVVSSWLHDDARRFFQHELPNLGIDVTFVDPIEARGWRRVTRGNTRLFFLASPVNPTTRVVDLNPPRLLAQELGIALVVDATFASPIGFRPLARGADVVIHSGAVSLHGEFGLHAGVVCGAEAVIDEVRDKMQVWGHTPDPIVIDALGRSLKTLEIRVRQQCASAERIAQWAEGRPSQVRVLYPGLPSHPDHAIASTTLDVFGSMILLELPLTQSAADVVARLRLFRNTATLGGVDSLACAIGERSVRLAVGVEDAADLMRDLAQAMD